MSSVASQIARLGKRAKPHHLIASAAAATMPSKKQYNLVQSDDLDSRVPLISEQAFQHGIEFNVKMIGSMDIPRPMTRVEIVAAMRRVRVEFKTKGVKKRKVTLSVSVDGVKTCLRKRKKKRASYGGNEDMVLKLHPIYRIFYVSHDSQDVKIFSYIARETSSNTFHCCVFKATKKKQALRIVRTVGQAFEVCHKLSSPAGEADDHDDGSSSFVDVDVVNEDTRKGLSTKTRQSNATTKGGTLSRGQNKTMPVSNKPCSASPMSGTKKGPSSRQSEGTAEEEDESTFSNSLRSTKQRPPPLVDTWRESISAQHETQLLKEKLEQQSMSTQAAVAQINLLRDQLAAEAAARVEAQSRTQQLLLHNKELLDHLQTLVRHIQELEGSDAPNLPQLTPRSKVERWFVMQPALEEILKRAESHPESGFVSSDKSLFSSLWARVQQRRRSKKMAGKKLMVKSASRTSSVSF